jgi:hypothetical protein
MSTEAATTQATAESAAADELAAHFATASPAELIQSMLDLGTRFFQASEAFDKAMQRHHQRAAQQAAPLLMPSEAPTPAPPPPAHLAHHGHTPASHAKPGELLSLGQISARLGFMVSAAFVLSLGFEPEHRNKSARLYSAADYPRMCAAIASHVSATAASHHNHYQPTSTTGDAP